ncbi:TnsA endonuclease N-terminal domain-containing protein [Vibrio parahaemolyticus]|uniref:TnsA endonuclease N-terminal domain-containing protein n=1 Tax=Vibrio parahaemolyticus TaxID=670 RepID=UPI001D4B95CD|nr:TnsA endonuclease N-terminal domain-containing protein [Vibrio parahaemolyticus]EJG1722898.1 TnsA endonuclease N-terminal domain-containing protein [Vibrio parahaemolyticus]EJG1736544.1 TnsA endonuclease N-terminal domain-containing protein [Vibrio parahaemolyticus]EJG1750386.1 TnsA endonuclease N-terminal domain-containing protein [Vibrio parahaemolyticus]EJG1754504.1 TnsA endonuclease N-terminal domain-containing protein [Vibrio parahaemolyticus]UYW18566.1 TnsA endonuclease N-terminal dom
MKKRILRNSSVKNISRFVSLKTNSIHTVESDLEFDACFHFEFSPQIVNFEAQPIGFEYFIEGKRRRYTPDFLVTYEDSYQSFYEIKPKRIAEKYEFKEKFIAQKEQALDCGKDLHVLTEDDIQIYPLLENLRIIRRYVCDDNLNSIQRQILSLFKKYGELRIEQVVQFSSVHSSRSLPALYDLIARQLLSIDMHQPIDWQTPIWSS